MSRRYDVAVVGAGILGAAAAYSLTRAGRRVLVLEAHEPGEGTSGNSFAWINAVRKEPEAYHCLNAAGVAEYDGLADELGTDIGYRANDCLERARRVFPPVRSARVLAARIGVRPMPADGHTIAGRVPGFSNVWVLVTHSGITLGPLLGRLIAVEICDGGPNPSLAPFRPDRFVRSI